MHSRPPPPPLPMAPVRKKPGPKMMAPQQVYLNAANEIKATGLSFRKAAEKYNVNYVTLRRFCGRLSKALNEGLAPIQNRMPDVQITPQLKISPKQNQQYQYQQLQYQQQQEQQQLQQLHQQQLLLQQQQHQKQQQQKQQLQQLQQQQQLQQPKIKSVQSQAINQAVSKPTSANNTPSPTIYKRPRQIFSIEQEEELAIFVRDTSIYYNGMSSKDVRTLAFVYGICNQVEMPQGWRETHQASFDWCLGFIKRNKLTPMMTTSHTFKNPPVNKNQPTKKTDELITKETATC